MTPEELEKLRNGNTKATVSESVKFERESPEETAKNHTLPSSALVDGDKQATVNLSPLDLKSSQDYYKVSNVDFAYRGENFVCKSSLKGTNHLLPVVLPKAEEPSKEKQKKAYFDYVQGETYTYEYLHEPTPKVIKNNNYVGLYEYLFIKEFEACKNGFLYYLVPLFLGVLGIILSFLEGAHILYNCLASVVVLLALLVIYPVFKDVTLSFAGLILRALAFVLIVAGSVMALVFLPQFRAQINVYIVFRLLVIVFDLYYTIKFYAIFFKMYAEDCKTNFANVVSVNAGPVSSSTFLSDRFFFGFSVAGCGSVSTVVSSFTSSAITYPSFLDQLAEYTLDRLGDIFQFRNGGGVIHPQRTDQTDRTVNVSRCVSGDDNGRTLQFRLQTFVAQHNPQSAGMARQHPPELFLLIQKAEQVTGAVRMIIGTAQ